VAKKVKIEKDIVKKNYLKEYSRINKIILMIVLVSLCVVIPLGVFGYLSYFGSPDTFTVYFYDSDGSTLPEPRGTFRTGEVIKYTGKTPSKEANEGIEYIFDGFNFFLREDGDVVAEAKYIEKVKTFTINYYGKIDENGDSELISSRQVEYNNSVSLVGASSEAINYTTIESIFSFTNKWYSTSDLSKQNTSTLIADTTNGEIAEVKENINLYAGYAYVARLYYLDFFYVDLAGNSHTLELRNSASSAAVGEYFFTPTGVLYAGNRYGDVITLPSSISYKESASSTINYNAVYLVNGISMDPNFNRFTFWTYLYDHPEIINGEHITIIVNPVEAGA
jgi:hypothetical protein